MQDNFELLRAGTAAQVHEVLTQLNALNPDEILKALRKRKTHAGHEYALLFFVYQWFDAEALKSKYPNVYEAAKKVPTKQKLTLFDEVQTMLDMEEPGKNFARVSRFIREGVDPRRVIVDSLIASDTTEVGCHPDLLRLISYGVCVSAGSFLYLVPKMLAQTDMARSSEVHAFFNAMSKSLPREFFEDNFLLHKAALKGNLAAVVWLAGVLKMDVERLTGRGISVLACAEKSKVPSVIYYIQSMREEYADENKLELEFSGKKKKKKARSQKSDTEDQSARVVRDAERKHFGK